MLSLSEDNRFYFYLLLFFNLVIYLFWLCWVFVAALAAASRGLLFVAVRGLLIAVASLCCGAQALVAQASVVVARGLSSCGSRALEHRLSSYGARA